MSHPLSSQLVQWYARHRRRLPWRQTRNPYHIWVAEIMLQQTQVETVIPYYQRWLKRFPTVAKLAAAPLEKVLAEWEGLGYYARARHLRRAAQVVVEQFGGQVPKTVEGLRALPGIGRYTAAAIASIAFGLDAAALDGNLKRVLARVFDIRQDVKSAGGEKTLSALAESLVPPGQAGEYNQALMDLGATICTPRAPRCEVCPVRSLCEAYQLGVQLERPVSRPRAPLPHREAAAGLIRKRGRLLLVRRPSDKLLGGLWAFPQASRLDGASLAASLADMVYRAWGQEIAVRSETRTLTQTFTHFRLTLHVFECQWLRGKALGSECRWVSPAALPDRPMGKADRQIARQVMAKHPAASRRSAAAPVSRR